MTGDLDISFQVVLLPFFLHIVQSTALLASSFCLYLSDVKSYVVLLPFTLEICIGSGKFVDILGLVAFEVSIYRKLYHCLAVVSLSLA